MQENLLNIADRLEHSASYLPGSPAIVFPESRDRNGRVAYTHLTFAQLQQETNLLANGLKKMGVRQSHRLVLMVRPGIEFIALTFAIFKTGATVVLIDPGMGRKRIFNCLDEIDPDGFVAIPAVHAIRKLRIGKYKNSRFNVCVSNHFSVGGVSYANLLKSGQGEFEPVATKGTDQAAIIFTSGSTGAPKGVVYEHAMFNAQVDLLQQQYDIQPGESDLPGFPLFALFNLAMGVTTVIPEMDPTKPAEVNPKRILEAIENKGITQAFGSPALWNRVGRYCVENKRTIPYVKRILSAGAPVPVHVLKNMKQACPDISTEMFTPYGATEALPVCSISASEVLEETSSLTAIGRGTCVGKPFPQVDVAIIKPVEGSIASMSESQQVDRGEIGEIIVRSPSVTREYFRKPEATRAAKIPDHDSFWHRMGDMGSIDECGRVWFCGRKAHIVHSANGVMYPVCCEAIFNQHEKIYRSALVGVGNVGTQKPVIIVEPEPGGFPKTETQKKQIENELLALGQKNELTQSIQTILFHKSLPVDRRHNVKIHREELAIWATTELKR